MFNIGDSVVLSYGKDNDPNNVGWIDEDMNDMVGNEYIICEIEEYREYQTYRLMTTDERRVNWEYAEEWLRPAIIPIGTIVRVKDRDRIFNTDYAHFNDKTAAFCGKKFKVVDHEIRIFSGEQTWYDLDEICVTDGVLDDCPDDIRHHRFVADWLEIVSSDEEIFDSKELDEFFDSMIVEDE